MAGERSFIVKLLGNADGAVAAFKKVAKEGERTLDQLRTVGDGLGKAFDVVQKGAFIALGAFTAVAGAATAAALAAAKDEQSQRLLANTLRQTTDAQASQIQAVERFIQSAMLATGVADDELRPAFENLVRATGDITQSQRLFNLAMDISAATGKDLNSVTIALGKSSEGQVASLQKLGVPIDENTKKSKDFNAAISQLEQTFGGASAAAADTFSGRLKILQTSLGEVVESIGFALLPFFERMVKFIQDNILPGLVAFADNIGEKGLVASFGYAIDAMGDFGRSFIDVFEQITLAVLNFLKNFVDLGRTIALTIGFTAALTGNAVLAVKATAASLAFKVAQDKLNGALAATPGLFDKLRQAADRAAQANAKALPSIIGTADALERAAGKVTKIETGGGGGGGGGGKSAIEIAKENLAKYTSSLKSAESALKSFNSSQRASRDATKSFNQATENLNEAQARFNRAVSGYGADSQEAKDAQRELAKSQRSVEQAGYRVEEAVFAVRDAEKKLAEVRLDPESTPQTIREAEIRLAQAKLAVADATDSQIDATTGLSKAQLALNEAVSGAVEGSATYNAFLKELNDAKERQTQASERLSDAIAAETDAYEALAEAIKAVKEAAKSVPGRQDIPTLPGFTMPTVPTPVVAGAGGTTGAGGGTSIVVNTGIGTNGIEAGRQIVDLLQQYSAVDANAINRLGFAPRR